MATEALITSSQSGSLAPAYSIKLSLAPDSGPTSRRRVALIEMRVQEDNRLQAPGSDDVRSSIEGTIAFLEAQIVAIDEEIRALNGDPTLRGKRELLESIPGIGERVSTGLLGEIPRLEEFRSSKALAAFVGLCPREYRSGSSVSASWLSKVGNSPVRKLLFLPAITACRFNPVLMVFAQRLRTGEAAQTGHRGGDAAPLGHRLRRAKVRPPLRPGVGP